MHWRKPFPPKNASVLDELIGVVRTSLHPEKVMAGKVAPAVELPDELPAAEPVVETPPALTKA
jgi:hypothetical protein